IERPFPIEVPFLDLRHPSKSLSPIDLRNFNVNLMLVFLLQLITTITNDNVKITIFQYDEILRFSVTRNVSILI
ncbi:MAG: hypothetical protein Q8893_02530, partial [Candidatus Phytoplasma australasiaticum]|nr:hypothetical protein [Candidatus Phytoplasma australasiaticum]